jgi:signal-transduction protein with cAMP-binding, CBS, and nucleotidyltransferase domain
MSLESDLKHEQVIHLDVGSFTEVKSNTSVKDAIEQMRSEGHNCAVITRQNKLVGIFTDRDLLRKVVDAPERWDKPIDEVMTAPPITVDATAPANVALDLMHKHHFRNVPVIDSDGRVIGNLTHYAIIKYLADRFPESVYNLPPDPDRVSRNRDGA